MDLVKSLKEERILSVQMHQERHVKQVQIMQVQETQINRLEIELTHMSGTLLHLQSISNHTSSTIDTVHVNQDWDSRAIDYLVDNAKRGEETLNHIAQNIPHF